MADSNVPADTEEDTRLTLVQRLAAIRSEASGIGKEPIEMANRERTKKWTIKAHTIEGVLHGVRALLDKHGVWMEPQLVERTFASNRCDALFAFRFESLDDPDDFRVIQYAGSGTDNSDKAFAKAGTNALKEMLKKVFLITDREDAKEEEDRVEYETEGASRAKLEKANEETRAAIEQWGNTLKSAIENAQDIDEIKRLERDNKRQLASEKLPEVTRTFFVDLITKRKAEVTQ